MIFNTNDLHPLDLNNVLTQLGKDQEYIQEEWDKVCMITAHLLFVMVHFLKGKTFLMGDK
tara:strand:- start:193 stop:372 length:180 start_codon:yes stop_codon:yes gene_type:complete